MRCAQRKNIRSRILCWIAPIDLKRATDCIRAIFRTFIGRKPPGVHVTKRKMYRRAVMERHWRNKRTGADDWPITRWPRYLRWYWLAIECLCNRKCQTRRHLVHLPFSPLSDRRPTLCSSLYLSLCYYLILYLSYLPDLACLSRAMPFSVTFRDEIGFMALFSSFVDNVYRQIAHQKSAALLLRRNNGVRSLLHVVSGKNLNNIWYFVIFWYLQRKLRFFCRKLFNIMSLLKY